MSGYVARVGCHPIVQDKRWRDQAEAKKRGDRNVWTTRAYGAAMRLTGNKDIALQAYGVATITYSKATGTPIHPKFQGVLE